MGKSSLRVRTMQRLQAKGTVCALVDLNGLGSCVSPEHWYTGIALNLANTLSSTERSTWRRWWNNHRDLSAPQRLGEFIEKVLLHSTSQPIVIFVDEIDTILSLDFSADDFLALIRFFYNSRADNPIFNRLTFALFGVATPSDLMRDKIRAPFNIGQAMHLERFQPHEVEPLLEGLRGFDHPEQILTEILAWTDGQPFLTQKLCDLVVNSVASISELNAAQAVTWVVQAKILENWERQDTPEHLKTIRDRLLSEPQQTHRLLITYQEILHQRRITNEESPEQVELLLSGLVIQQQNRLRVSNRIYESVFNQFWLNLSLAKQCPYLELLQLWLRRGCPDDILLLQRQALENALSWAKGKRLSIHDYEFLAASQAFEIKSIKADLQRERQWRLLLDLGHEKLKFASNCLLVLIAGLFVVLLLSIGRSVAL
jgi:AAA-like domain